MTDLEVIPDANHDGQPDRPKCTRAFVEALIEDAGFTDRLAIVGRRGYFDDLGVPDKNDVGLYDDAIFILTPSEFHAFNANTDPSRGAMGQAVLQPGRHLYELGPHPLKPPNYPAMRQHAAVTILRVGATKPEVGFFGINIHKGGFTKTGSAGCQTIHPTQWDEYIATATRVMRFAGIEVIPYILTAYKAA